MDEMPEEHESERRRLIEEALKNVKLEGSQREHFVRLLERLESDDEALMVLKGHLVLEERLTAVIEKFVFHPEFLRDSARRVAANEVRFVFKRRRPGPTTALLPVDNAAPSSPACDTKRQARACEPIAMCTGTVQPPNSWIELERYPLDRSA